MKKLLFCCIVALLTPLTGYNQNSPNGQNPQNSRSGATVSDENTTLNRTEYTAAIGLSQFLGDLGGSPQIGTHFLHDFNLGAIRWAGYLGYRRRLRRSWSVKGALTIADLYGNDALSSNPYRHNRNQNFRSLIFEPSVQLEYHFYQYDQVGHRYRIKHAHGFRKLSIDTYIFAGLGGFYFNPQGMYKGTWYDLRPLSTEGEGLPGGPPQYSQFAICIPAGVGAKYFIDRQWSVGIEFSDRLWTSTDYLDDTHGKYFSPEEILEYKGPVAAYFSHPVLGTIPGQDIPGTERGDPTFNDAYMFLLFTVNRRINGFTVHHHRR